MGKPNYPKKPQNIVYFYDWGQLYRPLLFQERVLRSSDIPTVFQEHIDKVLDFKTPVWLDDNICVTNAPAEDHEQELREVLYKLKNAGYRASEKKTELLEKELTWLGYYMNQNGEKPIKDNTEALTKLEAPKNVKELK